MSGPSMDEDRSVDQPDAACAAALARLPGMGPATLVAILRQWSPQEAWARVCDGSLRRPGGRHASGDPERLDWGEPAGGAPRPAKQEWRDAAARVDPTRWWAGHAAHGIGVTWPGQATYPRALAADPQPPGVLFWRGSLAWLDCPCVALVGTRRASPDGRAVAFEMGRDLAAAGVCVVSGLALGIDAAAHLGALRAGDQPGAAGPVGVAASGVDVAYPRQHAGLWEKVVAAGAVVSENLPGRPAQAWRFPSRNRVIAGLVRMVVVVESHAAGGSLITAEAAIARGIDVRVVPGPVHSPASVGSNQLLYDGPGPVRNAQDVLDGLGIFLSGPRDLSSPGSGRTEGLPADARTVLDTIGWQPTSLNRIIQRTGLGVARTMAFLDELEARGLVGCHQDCWVRRKPT